LLAVRFRGGHGRGRGLAVPVTLGEDQGRGPVDHVRQLGVGQIDQGREHEDQVHEIGDVAVGLQSEVVKELGDEAGGGHDQQ